MNQQIIFCTLIGFLPLVMLIVLLSLIKKAGGVLLKVKSSETIPYATISLICFVGCIYLLFFRKSYGHEFYAVSTLLIGVYMTSHSFISRNTIRQKGIIILNPFPSLLKWADIDSFGVYERKIYFKKKNKSFASIVASNEEVEDIVKVISENVTRKVLW